MDGDRVEVTLASTTLEPHERLEIRIALTNSSSQAMTFPAVPDYMATFNGKTSESSTHLASIENYPSDLRVAPGETIHYSYSQGLELALVPTTLGLARSPMPS